MRALLLILSLCLAPLHAGAEYVGDEMRLNDFVLAPENFRALPIEQQVAYMKTYITFLSSIEDMEDLPGEEKEAILGPGERLFAEFVATANADGRGLAGTRCISGLDLSTWEENAQTHRVVCKPLPSPSCGQGKRLCSRHLAEMMPDASHACVYDTGNITQKCVDNMMRDPERLEAGIRKSMSRNGYGRNVPEIKTALRNLHVKRYGGMSVREYCASPAASRQRAECGKMTQLANAFDLTVVAGVDPYGRKGRQPYTVSAESRRRLEDIQNQRRFQRENPCESHTYARDPRQGDVLFVPTNCNTRQVRNLRYRNTRVRYGTDYPPKPLPGTENEYPRDIPIFGPIISWLFGEDESPRGGWYGGNGPPSDWGNPPNNNCPGCPGNHGGGGNGGGGTGGGGNGGGGNGGGGPGGGGPGGGGPGGGGPGGGGPGGGGPGGGGPGGGGTGGGGRGENSGNRGGGGGGESRSSR